VTIGNPTLLPLKPFQAKGASEIVRVFADTAAKITRALILDLKMKGDIGRLKGVPVVEKCFRPAADTAGNCHLCQFPLIETHQ